MPIQEDDGFSSPVGGIGSNNREYGGKSRFARNHPIRPSHDAQIEAALKTIREEAGPQPITPQQLAHRLRLFLRDEYDVFLSPDEAYREVQKRQP